VTAEESRTTVMEFLAAREKGDAEATRRLSSDDLCWEPPGPFVHAVKGREAVLDMMANAGAQYFDLPTMEVDVHKVVADGDTVVIIQSVRAKTAKGADYSNLYCWVYTCKDGKVTRMQEFTDTQHFAEIMNG
jgi:hypothetical protein